MHSEECIRLKGVIDYDMARRDGCLLGRRAIFFQSTAVGKSWRRVVADILNILSQNQRLLKIPPVGFERASYQMEMNITACDPEKERSRKILQPEIDLAQDFQNVALARVLFTGQTFFEKKSISGQSWRQKLRIRMREAVAGEMVKNKRLRAKYRAPSDGVHGS